MVEDFPLLFFVLFCEETFFFPFFFLSHSFFCQTPLVRPFSFFPIFTSVRALFDLFRPFIYPLSLEKTLWIVCSFIFFSLFFLVFPWTPFLFQWCLYDCRRRKENVPSIGVFFSSLPLSGGLFFPLLSQQTFFFQSPPPPPPPPPPPFLPFSLCFFFPPNGFFGPLFLFPQSPSLTELVHVFILKCCNRHYFLFRFPFQMGVLDLLFPPG